MGHEQWTAVDRYVEQMLVPVDDALTEALAASKQAGLPAIEVTAAQGKLLHLLARACGARRILELGTLGGYSTIWLARALPEDGRLVTLELDPGYAEAARTNIANAGLGGRVELRVGPALETLAALADEQPEPFDLVFIDADKASNADYLAWALQLSRDGTLIVADNVIRDGAVADPDTDDAGARGVRRFFDLIAADPRIDATAIQTVGAKGWDGFLLGTVRP
ncbi:MAG: O-methyltransferase [Thermoleophilaceae bacterium]